MEAFHRLLYITSYILVPEAIFRDRSLAVQSQLANSCDTCSTHKASHVI
jgi:hypothetical protein